MAYIKKERRDALWNDSLIDRDDRMLNSEELSFRITELFVDYIESHDLTYESITSIIGAIDSAKMEFNRRVVVPYLEYFRKENGDIYPVFNFAKPKRTRGKSNGTK